MVIQKCFRLPLLLVVIAITACNSSSPKTPDEFLKKYYFTLSEDSNKAMALLDSATLPVGDKNAQTFVSGMLKMDHDNYHRHGGVDDLEEVKTWVAQRDPKYTGFSLKLRFKDGSKVNGRGYITQQDGEWRMTSAMNQG